MKVYIAGKVTGETPYAVMVKFGRAETRLRAMGFEPVNPVTLCREAGATEWIECMELCTAELKKCGAVLLLDDWRESNGARIERMIADILCKDIYTESMMFGEEEKDKQTDK